MFELFEMFERFPEDLKKYPKNTYPGQLFPVGIKLKKIGGGNTSHGDFVYKFGQNNLENKR